VGKKAERKTYFRAGIYLLETLTAGMYNEPLSIYREYIQNAVDSIDLLNRKNNGRKMKVNIELNPFERSITISDNGSGIPV
jgi:HSP90 family molecular chaperone